MKPFLRKIRRALVLAGRKTKTLNRVEIIADNLVFNFRLLKKLASGKEPFPVLKSNAYGHGLEVVAKILEKEKPVYLAVDSYFEALRVRDVCSIAPLIIGPNVPADVKHIVENGFTFTINNFAILDALVQLRTKATIHIALNTGMNREGFQRSELPEVIRVLEKNKFITVEGVFSHFADADGENDVFTQDQEKEFSACLDVFEKRGITFQWVHLGNSAGFLQTADTRINAFRPGKALYGENQLPQWHQQSRDLEALKPALRMISTVTNVQKISKGDFVGYNCDFVAPKDMAVAIIPVGYYEALDRRLGNTGYLKIGEDFHEITGRICMNLTAFDTQNKDITVGDAVVVISDIPGDKNFPSAIAKSIGTNSYEVLTRIDRTVRRVVV